MIDDLLFNVVWLADVIAPEVSGRQLPEKQSDD
jgi:hypothetical protein